MIVKTDYPIYLIDLDSNALLANDLRALHNHRKKISESQQINNLRNEVNDIKHKLDLVLYHLQDIRGTNA